MKQILQELGSGETTILEVPAPTVSPKHLLIQTQRSLISAGTERMLVEFGQASLLAKARSQPERVQQVLDKMRTDGVLPTLESVFNKLGQPLPLGYCNAGTVIAVGKGVTGFAVGDRVVSNGAHAEIVNVPQNLCARIPDNVSDSDAAFTVLAAIGLQGVRLAEPALGEKVVVMGLGLIGLLTVQMLRANGCQVLGMDFNRDRLAMAAQFGAETVDLSVVDDPVPAAIAFSNGRGVDSVIITASTKSNDPVHNAAQMSRQRGRIILVGVVGLELSRADFYEKELTFQVSCSYGPGRYDENYEYKGHDYPYGFVRWTEQRNFEAILDLLSSGRLNVHSLISHTIPQGNAQEAYQLLTDDPQALGIVLSYPEEEANLTKTVASMGNTPKASTTQQKTVRAGVIGAGNFATAVILPAIAKSEASLEMIASSQGTSAAVAAKKFNIPKATSDTETILNDESVNTTFILTRHNSHASLIERALNAGQHVFVEKPLALNRTELNRIEQAVQAHPQQHLLVGFNRRFSPLAKKMKSLLQGRAEPISVTYTVNAGMIPADHWTQDPDVGGGRIIGEGCHFIDLIRYLVGHPITGVKAQMMGEGVDVREDKMSILLSFADGSMGTVHYMANGNKKYPKERVELFSEGRMLLLDNYRLLQGFGWPGFRQQKLWRQDKGHSSEINEFVEQIQKGGEWLIPWEELKEVTLASFIAVEDASQGSSSLE